jgi:hypothetical protein
MKVYFYCTSRTDKVDQPGLSEAAETEEDKKQSDQAMSGAEDDKPAEMGERQEQSAPYRSVVEDEPAETKEQLLTESGQAMSEVKDGSAETESVAGPRVAIRVYGRRRKVPVLVYQRRRKGHSSNQSRVQVLGKAGRTPS